MLPADIKVQCFKHTVNESFDYYNLLNRNELEVHVNKLDLLKFIVAYCHWQEFEELGARI